MIRQAGLDRPTHRPPISKTPDSASQSPQSGAHSPANDSTIDLTDSPPPSPVHTPVRQTMTVQSPARSAGFGVADDNAISMQRTEPDTHTNTNVQPKHAQPFQVSITMSPGLQADQSFNSDDLTFPEDTEQLAEDSALSVPAESRPSSRDSDLSLHDDSAQRPDTLTRSRRHTASQQ